MEDTMVKRAAKLWRCHWRSGSGGRCISDVGHTLLEDALTGELHIRSNLSRFTTAEANYDPLEEQLLTEIVACSCGAMWTDTQSWLRAWAEENHADHEKRVLHG